MVITDFNHWARAQPDRTALILNDRSLSFGRLARSIEAVRRYLAAEALSNGGLAVVCAADLLNAWVLVTAIRALGLTAIAVASLNRAHELGLKGVSCIIVAESEQALLNAGVRYPGAAALVVPSAVIEAADGLEGSADQIDVSRSGDYILYSSGTTGSYKKLLFDGAQDAARAQARVALSGFSRETIFHALNFGLWTGVGFRAPSAVWSAGGCVVIDQTPAKHTDFFKHRPTYADVLPETLRALVAAHAAGRTPTERPVLRVAGGFTSLALAREAITCLSKTLLASFSATETAGPTMISEFRAPDDLVWLKPVDPDRVQIVDENGAAAPPDVAGELRFRLRRTDCTAYLDDPEASAAAFRDGCFYSGDIAVRRSDGRVRVLGRTVDVINIQGQKRPAGPIEQALEQALGVAEVCLLQGVAVDGAEELVVAVRSREPLDASAVLRRLGPSEIFERVRVEVFADFPRTDGGTQKTRRAALRRLVFPD